MTWRSSGTEIEGAHLVLSEAKAGVACFPARGRLRITLEVFVYKEREACPA